MKDYLVTVTIRNNYLHTKMVGAGFQNAQELSKASGIWPSIIYRYLSLKEAPIGRNGDFKPSIIKLADFLRCLPDDLFPPQHLRETLKKNKATTTASAQEVYALANNVSIDKAKMIPFFEVGDCLKEAMKNLTPRQALVIEKRFNQGLTLQEIAKEMNVSRQLIRVIESKALSKLRNPKFSPKLNQYRDDVEKINYDGAELWVSQ